jgi:hypothetical protein
MIGRATVPQPRHLATRPVVLVVKVKATSLPSRPQLQNLPSHASTLLAHLIATRHPAQRLYPAPTSLALDINLVLLSRATSFLIAASFSEATGVHCFLLRVKSPTWLTPCLPSTHPNTRFSLCTILFTSRPVSTRPDSTRTIANHQPPSRACAQLVASLLS